MRAAKIYINEVEFADEETPTRSNSKLEERVAKLETELAKLKENLTKLMNELGVEY